MNRDDLGFDSTASALTVTQLRERFPAIPLRVLVTLWFVTVMERTVAPFRLCECGCGAAVHGKARLDSPACRQRVSRQRRALAATGPKQFGLTLQHEIPVPIPTVPRNAVTDAGICGDGVIKVPAHRITPFRDGKTIWVTGYNHGARRADGSEPFEVVFNENQIDRKVRQFKNATEAEAKLKIEIDWSRFTSQPNEPELFREL